jgi:hypothetical protein
MTGKTLWIAIAMSIVIIAGFVLLFQSYAGNADQLSALGDFIAGAGSLLAFVWLIATVMQQSAQLRMQGEELRFQREALQTQQRDSARTAQHSALALIATAIENFHRSVAAYGVPGVQSPHDIPTVLALSVSKDWPVLKESKEQKEVFDAWTRWARIEGLAQQAVILAALSGRIYADSNSDAGLVDVADDAEYVVKNQVALGRVATLVPYLGTALVSASALVAGKPVRERFRETGLGALNAMFPGASGQEAFTKAINRAADATSGADTVGGA